MIGNKNDNVCVVYEYTTPTTRSIPISDETINSEKLSTIRLFYKKKKKKQKIGEFSQNY